MYSMYAPYLYLYPVLYSTSTVWHTPFFSVYKPGHLHFFHGLLRVTDGWMDSFFFRYSTVGLTGTCRFSPRQSTRLSNFVWHRRSNYWCGCLKIIVYLLLLYRTWIVAAWHYSCLFMGEHMLSQIRLICAGTHEPLFVATNADRFHRVHVINGAL